MELFLIRHGESQDNAQLTLSKDSELTPLGEEQAYRAGQTLKSERIQHLFCSAQIRSLQTATIIGKAIGIDPEVVIDLTERNFCWTENGLSRSAMISRFPNAALPPEIDEEGWARKCSREKLEVLSIRMNGVAQLFREMANKENCERVACVVHQGSCSMLLRSLLSVAPDSNTYFRHRNCGISQIILKEEQSILFKLNDVSHLTGLAENSLKQSIC